MDTPALILLLALALDLLLGDPPNRYHPVALMGNFIRGMARLGLRVVPSAANFLLVEVGDGRGLRRKLLPHGLLVRDCTSFGLPEHVRIAVRRMEECHRLIKTLHQLLIRDS